MIDWKRFFHAINLVKKYMFSTPSIETPVKKPSGAICKADAGRELCDAPKDL